MLPASAELFKGEVQLSRSVWERIEKSRAREAISPEEADTVVAAAESAFLANWRLLDGVS